ncbi:MAG: hypothetical protein ACM30I_13505 [Gemmatimonas sp.]
MIVAAENQRKPKWDIWRHVPEAKVWEAVALSLDIEPRSVNIDRNSWVGGRLIFQESEEFKSRVFLASRNLNSGAFRATALVIDQPEACGAVLSEFANWGISVGWKVPEEFAALAARRHGGGAPGDSAPLEGKALTTALKLILGMALAAYNYDPKSGRSGVPKEVSDDLQRHGISVSDDTVRQWLTRAADEIEWKLKDGGRR